MIQRIKKCEKMPTDYEDFLTKINVRILRTDLQVTTGELMELS